MKLFLIAVGNLKDKRLKSLEEDYLKRIKIPFDIIEIKALGEDLVREGQAVAKKINEISPKQRPKVILLTENGKQLDSPSFSQWLYQNLEGSNAPVIFVLGGASGHGKNVYDLASESFSLGKLTYPHQIARLIMVEQIYRAETIKNNHPYHK